MKDIVKILGCRGSVPVSGEKFAHYGGATSCVFLRLGDQAIVLDAGTGILNLSMSLTDSEQDIPLLLSHPHADHLMGLPMCSEALRPGRHFHIWASETQGLTPEDQLRAFMAPPLWPVGPEKLPADFSFYTIDGRFSLGPVLVDTIPGDHPGGVTLFRLTCRGKSVVYIPDCTLLGDTLTQVSKFAKGCDLLLCDGQYSPESWVTCSGFGHSTFDMAADLGRQCGAAMTRIIHIDPTYGDNMIRSAEEELINTYDNCRFAFEGEEILL